MQDSENSIEVACQDQMVLLGYVESGGQIGIVTPISHVFSAMAASSRWVDLHPDCRGRWRALRGSTLAPLDLGLSLSPSALAELAGGQELASDFWLDAARAG